LSWPKKIVFSLIVLVLSAVISDLFVQLIDLYVHGSDYGKLLVKRRMSAADSVVESVRSTLPEVVHPYVGFVLDPTANDSVNEFGFIQIDGPILERSDDQFSVGISGGSVARYLCELNADTIKARLSAALTKRSGTPVQVKLVCCAQQGFRQPQQLMTWTYLNSIGAQFDCFVCLDGFNEVALQPAENPHDEACYFYPRKWELRVFDENDGELNRLLYRGKLLRSVRHDWARRMAFADRFPGRIPLHLWNGRDLVLQSELMTLVRELSQVRDQHSRKYSATGPTRQFSSSDDRLKALVKNWSANSALLATLCRSRQTCYVHVLQPNLHYEGSKRFSSEEKKLLERSGEYAEPAALGYPLLREAGRTLKEQNVQFFDATQLFANIDASVYTDSCCHLNRYGNQLLAEYVCDCILEACDREGRR
jgi:hypothetical protein